MILVLGGTSEGRELTKIIRQRGFSCLLSVATGLGKELARDLGSNVISGELNPTTFKQLFQDYPIEFVLDATHPYAIKIKQIASEVAREQGIIYGRYERERTALPIDANVIKVNTYQAAFELLSTTSGDILFTIGVNNLPLFQPLWTEQQRSVWVKVYPLMKSMEICGDLKLPPERIFAFHGAGSKDIFKALITLTDVAWIVTKESGMVGGTDLKVAATLETGRNLLLIERPIEQGELVFRDFNEVINFLEEKLSHIKGV